MTKIVTGLVAIDLISDRLDQTVTLSRGMIGNTEGASLGLAVGETYTYRDLLYSAVCGGFNDAAYALASACTGSVNAFVSLMNEKAQSLGAVNTHYTNPTGWHDSQMYTTLEDTVLICKAAAKSELYMEISSAVKYQVSQPDNKKNITINNRNGLIGTYYTQGYYTRYANGLIAGMTDEGGYCVATVAKTDGFSYLCIVMGASEEAGTVYSYDIARSLISYVASYYGYLDVLSAGDEICELPLGYTVSSQGGKYMLPCHVEDDLRVFIPHDKNSIKTLDVKHYFFEDPTYAPINEGDVVGGVDVYVDGNLVGSVPLYASQTVDANRFLLTIDTAKNLITSRSFIITAIIFIILLLIYYYLTEFRSRRKQTKNIKYNNLY